MSRIGELQKARELARQSRDAWACMLADSFLIDGCPSPWVVGEYREARERHALADAMAHLEIYGVFPERLTVEMIHARWMPAAAVQQ